MIAELFKDMGKYLPSYIVPAVVSFFSIPIITHLFDPEDYGNYIIIVSSISVLTAITTACIGASLIRFFPTYDNQPEQLLTFYGNAVRVMFLSIISISIVVLILIYFNSRYIPPKIYNLIKYGFLVFLASAFWSVMQYSLRAQRKIFGFSLFAIWRSIVGLGLGLLLVIIFQQGMEGLLLGQFISMAIILPIVGIIVLRRIDLRQGRLCSSINMKMARYGMPIAIVNIFSWVLSLSDNFIIEMFRGSCEVGLYSASYNISEKMIFIIAFVFMMAEGPIAFKIWESENVEETIKFRTQITKYYCMITIPAVVGLSVLAKQVVMIMTVPAYYDGYKIIPLIVIGAFLIGLAHRFVCVFSLYERTEINMYCILSAGMLNICLNFIFIPYYGYMAAAVTTLISYGVFLLSVIIVSRRFLIWKFPLKSLAKIICASAIMGIMVYAVNNQLNSSSIIKLVTGICVGIITYTSILLLLKELKLNEIITICRKAPNTIQRNLLE